MGQKILIVEDEKDINDMLARVLEAGGYQTVSAYTGTEGLALLEQEKPDLMLMDLMLPEICGEELLRKIRREKRCNVPVVVITARGAVREKVDMLNAGADDYITKPFEPEEVVARVEAVLRRVGKDEAGWVSYKSISILPRSRRAVLNGEELDLTAREYDILYLLVQNPEKVFSRERLYELVWDGGYYGENNTVNVHVSNLRRKFRAAGLEEEYIHTVYGIGFQLK